MVKRSSTRSSSMLPVMVAGGVIVVALVTWSLSRMASSRDHVAPGAPPAAVGSATPEHVHSPELDAVPRIKPQELRDRIARGEVTVIDVRDAQSYLSGHIPGALHIPMTRLDGEIAYLPKNKPIVTYCT